MSQDLLAEFGDFTIKEDTNQHGTAFQAQPSFSQSTYRSDFGSAQLQTVSQPQVEDFWGDDDDDFGDFEEPEPKPEPEPKHITQAPAKKTPPQPVKEVKPVSNPVPPAKKSSGPPVILKKAAKASQLPSNHPFAGHADILFDADEYDEFEDADVVGSWGEEEDDFGDFETSETPAVSNGTPQRAAPPAQPKTAIPSAKAASSAAVDLLGWDDPPERIDRAESHTAASKALSKSTSAPKSTATRPTAAARQQSVLSNDDAWDDFETSQPSRSAQSVEAAPQIQLPKDILGDLTALPATTGVAPSNIPPPSVLLTIFPSVLSSLAQRFLHPISTLSPTQKSLFLSAAETNSFLASYVTLTHTLGRIIAGRKSRWKRDKHLAQSMRIGPAMSGRSGGMKLTGLDKSEAGREDTEVEVVLAVWREQVGRLKTAVTGASVHGSKLNVPELAVVLPVRVAKGSEGAITSAQACALCGLKREERVAKVDVAVEDSFGEFWIEGTNMHRACLKFWELFKNRLMSR